MSNNWFLFILKMFGGQTIIVLEPDIFHELKWFLLAHPDVG